MKKGKRFSDRFYGGIIVSLLVSSSAVLGSVGWIEYLGSASGLTWTDVAYRLLTLFTVNASFDQPGVPLALDLARFLSPLAVAGTVVFVAMSFFRSRMQAFSARYAMRGHAVFYGFDKRAAALASDISAERKVLCIARSAEEAMRAAEMGAASIFEESAFSQSFIACGLRRARCLFVMTESDVPAQEASRSAEDFLRNIRRSRKAGGLKRLPSIFVGYSDESALRIAREFDEAAENTPDGRSESVRVFRFNPELHLARALVDTHVLGSPPNPEMLRAAVFGFAGIGQAIAFEIAQTAHFGDLSLPRISLCDRGIEASFDEFLARHPGFDAAASAEVVEASQWKKVFSNDLPDIAFISFDDSSLALETARVLRQLSVLAGKQTRIIVIPPLGREGSYPSEECCGGYLRSQDIVLVDSDGLVNGLDIMRRAEDCDALAKGIHFSWLASESMRWDSELIDAEWDRLSDVLRDSNRYAARHLLIKLRFLGWHFVSGSAGGDGGEKFELESYPRKILEQLGRMEHNRWAAEKLLAGYLPYADSSDSRYPEFKAKYHLHANLVPWESLSEEDQRKDLNALKYANEIAAAAGLRLTRICPAGED